MTKITLSVLLLFAASLSYGQADINPIFSPKLGVCTSVNNHAIVAAAGFDYIEEGVGRFLVPEKPEEDFHLNLAVLKESSIPVLACNGFLPGSLKTTGPNPQHEEILAFAEIAFRRAQEARRILGHMHIAEKGKRTAPGLSGDNFVPYLMALKKAGYNGGISIEGSWGQKEDFEKTLFLPEPIYKDKLIL